MAWLASFFGVALFLPRYDTGSQLWYWPQTIGFCQTMLL
jgi:hypothetical protein